MGHSVIYCSCGEYVMESTTGHFECDKCGAEWINGKKTKDSKNKNKNKKNERKRN